MILPPNSLVEKPSGFSVRAGGREGHSPRGPHPVNETLQEPLGRVNPRCHLLLVLGRDNKQRPVFQQAGCGQLERFAGLTGGGLGDLLTLGSGCRFWLWLVRLLASHTKAPALNASTEAPLWFFIH